MNPISRRDFVKAATTSAIAAPSIFAVASSASAAPNDRVRHAVIGVGGQGQRHARTFDGFDDCDVVAVCDVDPERRAKAAGSLSDPKAVEQVEQFQAILDDDSIDTVSVVTPDHWHTPVALHALAAGKHVYVEKPCSHNLHEGRVLERAAAASGLCVQHGTQRRSGAGNQEAMQFLREGNLGKVRMAKAIDHQLRGPIGTAEPADPPEGVHYDLWLGPAPKHPFTRNRWHYKWHWFWDYGTGDMGNDGVHHVDLARWGLGVTYPNRVSASGGQLFYNDDHETPDTQVVTFEYDDCFLTYEMRLWTDYPLEGHNNGAVFYGDKGILEIGRNGVEVTFIGEPKKKLGSDGNFNANLRNFLDCVKNDTPEKLNAPISEGVASAALCHLGNIATRVKTDILYDAENNRITNNDEANALVQRTYREGYGLPEEG